MGVLLFTYYIYNIYIHIYLFILYKHSQGLEPRMVNKI